MDAFDVWLELKAEDAEGRSSTGMDGSRTTVRARRSGRALLSRSAASTITAIGSTSATPGSARALAYVRLIPPGAADTAHFRLRIPSGCGGAREAHGTDELPEVRVVEHSVGLCGSSRSVAPDFAISKRYDDGRWVFTGDTSDVSGTIKTIPDLPVDRRRSRTSKLTRRGRADRAAGALRGGSRALERLRHRAAPAEGLQGGRLGLRDRDTPRARIRRWLGQPREGRGRGGGSCSRARARSTRLSEIDAELPEGSLLPRPSRCAPSAGTTRRPAGPSDHDRTVFPRDRVVWNAIGRILFLKRQIRRSRSRLTRRRSPSIPRT